MRESPAADLQRQRLPFIESAPAVNSYETAVRYFDHAARLMGLSQNMQRLLLTPEREVKVQIALERDNGEIATFIGYRMQHDSARAVTKQHAGVAVCPVYNARKSFCAYNQNVLITAGLDEFIGNRQCVDKTGTYRLYFKGWATTQTKLFLQK